jgi:hypothetical protein
VHTPVFPVCFFKAFRNSRADQAIAHDSAQEPWIQALLAPDTAAEDTMLQQEQQDLL